MFAESGVPAGATPALTGGMPAFGADATAAKEDGDPAAGGAPETGGGAAGFSGISRRRPLNKARTTVPNAHIPVRV